VTAFDLFTIGHSNNPAERFVDLLRGADVSVVADVRSTPASRFCPWFSATNLAPRLQQQGMDYQAFGDSLGGRPRDPALYSGGVADYEAMAERPAFRAGLDRLLQVAAGRRVCLMCSEREPLDCHRCLLVTRALAERGLSIGHILQDGTIESQPDTEARLLALGGTEDDLFAPGHAEALAAAYRRRAAAVAYRTPRRKAAASPAQRRR